MQDLGFGSEAVIGMGWDGEYRADLEVCLDGIGGFEGSQVE